MLERAWFSGSCLDAAAEKALLPSFDGCIGEIKIPGKVIPIFLSDLSFEICISNYKDSWGKVEN